MIEEDYNNQCGSAVSEIFNSGPVAIANNGSSADRRRNKIRVKYDNGYSNLNYPEFIRAN